MWDSSIVLAKYLEREGHTAGRRGGLMRGKVVLELGSGAGLLGLTALHLGAKKVYCTEYSRDLPVLRALEANITAAHNLGGCTSGGDLHAHAGLGSATARVVPTGSHRTGWGTHSCDAMRCPALLARTRPMDSSRFCV
eukprot:COSAG02_NODE_24569_length_684_cov_0.762393_1_plen_138_part_00